MQLVCHDTLDQIDAHLTDLVARVFTCDGHGAVARLHETIARFVLAGGKRIRPQLCLWTMEKALGGDAVGKRGGDRFPREARARLAASPCPHSSASLDLACAWELFHAFLLAHDDIIDAADTRRDRPSLHRELALIGVDVADAARAEPDESLGVNLAIVAGDLLFGAATRVLHELDVPHDVHRRLLRLFSRVVCTTGFGQAVDIAQGRVPLADACERTLLREYHWKTAAYTFEGPMLSGAIAAGLGEPAQAALSRFALALGQAYQLQNDLVDLRTRAHEGCDLIQGKRTVTLLRARAAMPPAQRGRFDARFDSLRTANGQAVAIAESLREELLGVGAEERTNELVDGFLRDARVASADDALPAGLTTGLRELLDALETRYFARAT